MSRVHNVNKHGLVTSDFRPKLLAMIKDLQYYKPKELARNLSKLAFAVDREAAINEIQHLETTHTQQLKDT